MPLKKGNYIRIGGKNTSDVPTAKRLLRQLMDQAADEHAERQAIEFATELGELVDRIDNNSSMRGRGKYAHLYNNPMSPQRAPVKITRRKRKEGEYTYAVEVLSPVFAILDAGSPPKITTNIMRFPRYRGNLTYPYPNSEFLKPGDVQILDRGSQEAEFYGGGWVTIPAGTQIAGFAPRRFYRMITDKFRKRTKDSLVKSGYVTYKLVKRK